MTTTYCDIEALKTRLGIENDAEDFLLAPLIEQASSFITRYTNRVLAPDSATEYVQDGFNALENGRLYVFPRGILELTKLEVGSYTGSPFHEVPANNYFLRPSGPDLLPGEPYTEVWMTNIPSAGNTYPVFFPGFNNVRFTGSFGWPAVPPAVTEVALNLAVTGYRARGASGGTGSVTMNLDGSRTYEFALSTKDRMTLDRYRYRPVVTI